MTGYIRPVEPELRVREFNIYNSYYCGLCKEIGETYGQASRLLLNHDMTFLALFLGGLTGGKDHIEMHHCIVHPLAKKPVENIEQSIRYAADMLIILAYEKYEDDRRDNDKSEIHGTLTGLKRKYQNACSLHPVTSDKLHEYFLELYSYEEKGKADIRKMATAFGNGLAAICTGYSMPEETRRIVEPFAENLGKWLYLIDIMDDFEEDKRLGRFNPMIDLGIPNREKAVEIMEPAMYFYLDEMCKAYDLLHFRKNKDILDNIVFLGLRQKTEEVLKGEKKNGK